MKIIAAVEVKPQTFLVQILVGRFKLSSLTTCALLTLSASHLSVPLVEIQTHQECTQECRLTSIGLNPRLGRINKHNCFAEFILTKFNNKFQQFQKV